MTKDLESGKKIKSVLGRLDFIHQYMAFLFV